MIEALSQQLLNQFAKNLTALIESDAAYAAETATSAQAAHATPDGAASAPGDQTNRINEATQTATTDASRPAVETRRPPPAPAPVVPLDAGALMRKAMWQSVRNFFARLFGAKQQH
jgi:hypothetical protein